VEECIREQVYDVIEIILPWGVRTYIDSPNDFKKNVNTVVTTAVLCTFGNAIAKLCTFVLKSPFSIGKWGYEKLTKPKQTASAGAFPIHTHTTTIVPHDPQKQKQIAIEGAFPIHPCNAAKKMHQ